MSRTRKFTDTESRLLVDRAEGEGKGKGDAGMIAKWCRSFFLWQ